MGNCCEKYRWQFPVFGGRTLFEKKEIIFSDVLGVCQVAELSRLPAKNGEQMLYYGLRSVYDKHKVSYIPVEHHQVLLRPLISYEEAMKRSEQAGKTQTDTEGMSGQMEEKFSETEKQEIQYVLAQGNVKK